MNFEQAKAMQAQIENAAKAAADALKSIDGVGSGNMGLTPDAVKASAEYRSAKAQFDNAFANLRNFNAKFIKHFAKEIRAERLARGVDPQRAAPR